MRVPILVMSPFRLSERTDDSTSVDPFSLGASSATHSSKPALSDCSVSCSCTSSHASSRAHEASSSLRSCASSMGGHTAADMVDANIYLGRSARCVYSVWALMLTTRYPAHHHGYFRASMHGRSDAGAASPRVAHGPQTSRLKARLFRSVQLWSAQSSPHDIRFQQGAATFAVS
jgi:hypothetical protein